MVFRDVLIQIIDQIIVTMTRSSRPDMFLRKGVLKICSKFTGEHPCRNLSEMTLRHWCSPVNLLHIFRTSFPKNTSRWLLVFLDTASDIFCLIISLSKNLIESSIKEIGIEFLRHIDFKNSVSLCK